MCKCTVYNLFLSKPHKDGDDHSKRSAFVHLKTVTLFLAMNKQLPNTRIKFIKMAK